MGTASDDRDRLRRMEGLLAGLLRWGALVASAWIAPGMAMALVWGPGPGSAAALAERCQAIGIVLLIALPAARVALTSGIFLLEGDYLFAGIAAVVLAIMAVGFLLG